MDKKVKVFPTNLLKPQKDTVANIKGDVFIRLEQHPEGADILACDKTGAMVVGGRLAIITKDGLFPCVAVNPRIEFAQNRKGQLATPTHQGKRGIEVITRMLKDIEKKIPSLNVNDYKALIDLCGLTLKAPTPKPRREVKADAKPTRRVQSSRGKTRR